MLSLSDAMKPQTVKHAEGLPAACLVEGVAAILAVEPHLEAVTVRPTDRSVSIATLGATEDAALNDRVRTMLQRMRPKEDGNLCELLTGKGDCSQCERPGHAEALPQLQISINPHATTLSRISCPTAPRFWRWRSLPLPRLVPRELDIHDDDEHLDEWKAQLAAAIGCGLLAHGSLLLLGARACARRLRYPAPYH